MYKRGFTLIELLVVVAVIGILSAIILVGLTAFRGQARDTSRLQDLRQAQTGLELYFNACGHYPINPRSWEELSAELITPSESGCAGSIGIIQVPQDPRVAGGETYEYGVNTAGTRYVLKATLEEPNSALQDDIDSTQAATVLGGTDSVGCGTNGPTEREYCVTI